MLATLGCGNASVTQSPADVANMTNEHETQLTSTDRGSEVVRDPTGSSGSTELGPFKRATAVDVVFEWRIEGDKLHGKMHAPTRGWVTVGFNTEPQLAGTKLVMGYVSPRGEVVLEEHIADPPNHRPKTELGGHDALSNTQGHEQGGETHLEFLLELDSGDPVDVVLVPGQRYHVTLAWSHEDDLYHHSARRSAVEIDL